MSLEKFANVAFLAMCGAAFWLAAYYAFHERFDGAAFYAGTSLFFGLVSGVVSITATKS